MAWYVFALVDAIPVRARGEGADGPLSIRKLAGAFAVVERRADVPPVEFGSLKKHQDVVTRLAAQVPAILPVRFGTLLEAEHLEEATRSATTRSRRRSTSCAAACSSRGGSTETGDRDRGSGIGGSGDGSDRRTRTASQDRC